MATDAHLRANKRYHEKHDDVRIRVPKGAREKIRKHAQGRGYAGIQPYLIDLLRADGAVIENEDK